MRVAEAATPSKRRRKSGRKERKAEKLRRGFSVVSCLGARRSAKNKFPSCVHRTGQLWVTFKRNSPVTTFSPLITCYTFMKGPTLLLDLDPILHASLRQYPSLLRETNITLRRRRRTSINFPVQGANQINIASTAKRLCLFSHRVRIIPLHQTLNEDL